MNWGDPCPLQAAFGRPTPLWEFYKGLGSPYFIILIKILIRFDICSVSLIIFTTLASARLFSAICFHQCLVVFAYDWQVINFIIFNGLIIFWGCVELTSLAWRLMCWSEASHRRPPMFVSLRSGISLASVGGFMWGRCVDAIVDQLVLGKLLADLCRFAA